MAKDKATETLLDALRQALAEPREQALFRNGKQPGLFPSKSSGNAAAAERALRDGLLEPVRTETKGKSIIQFVRITPAGVAFLHDYDSPLRALNDLKAMLQSSRQAVPAWLSEMQTTLQRLSDHIHQEAERWTQHLHALEQRVTEALRRMREQPIISNGMTEAVPWATDALAYLNRRLPATNAMGPCSFPELFAALKKQHDDLSLTNFHNGLRRLQDGRVVRLLPYRYSPDQLPQPEYALLDGGLVLYYVEQ